MEIISKIQQRLRMIYRKDIVREQYPMLTTLSKKEWEAKGALGIIYMLHHICERNANGIPTNEDLKVSPKFLERTIIKYKQRGFDFISLDEFYERITNKTNPERPFVIFTIDDGYLDNYTNALPLFERYQVPFAVFIATDFIDKKAILWWDSLEGLIRSNSEIVLSNGTKYPCRTFQERWDTFRIIREMILKEDQNQLAPILQRLFSNYEIDWFEAIQHKAMSWEQVIELSKHPLCTIGGHTVSHPALDTLTKEAQYLEIKKGNNRLESETGKKILYFAYPYGAANECSFQIADELGFKCAFMANGGCVLKDSSSKLFSIPRTILSE